MPNPTLQAIQTWLKHHKDIDADLEDGHLTFKIQGINQYVNRLMLFHGGCVLSWYGYTLIPSETIRDSPHRATLMHELLLLNDRLALGRWALNRKDLLLFDVSLPLTDDVPCGQVLRQVFEVMSDGFDLAVSRIKLLLETGVVLSSSDGDVPLSCLKVLSVRPDVYPVMHRLGLLPEAADEVLRQWLPLPELARNDVNQLEGDAKPVGTSSPAVH